MAKKVLKIVYGGLILLFAAVSAIVPTLDYYEKSSKNTVEKVIGKTDTIFSSNIQNSVVKSLDYEESNLSNQISKHKENASTPQQKDFVTYNQNSKSSNENKKANHLSLNIERKVLLNQRPPTQNTFPPSNFKKKSTSVWSGTEFITSASNTFQSPNFKKKSTSVWSETELITPASKN